MRKRALETRNHQANVKKFFIILNTFTLKEGQGQKGQAVSLGRQDSLARGTHLSGPHSHPRSCLTLPLTVT